MSVKNGKTIALNMALLSCVTSRWTGRVAATVQNVAVQGDGGSTVDMKITESQGKKSRKKALTVPQYVLDDVHELFRKIDATDREKDAAILRYTAPESSPGVYLVPMGSAQFLLAELSAIRDRRLRIVRDELQPLWDTEIRAAMHAKFPQVFNTIIAKLPTAASLPDRYDMQFTLRPLTPIHTGDIDLSSLNNADRDRVIKQSNDMIKAQTDKLMQNVYSSVFGGLLTVCEEITSRQFFSGSRKQGALNEILDAITRVKSFGQLAPAGLLAAASSAEQVIRQTNAKDVNNLESVQTAITQQFAAVQAILAADESIVAARRVKL